MVNAAQQPGAGSQAGCLARSPCGHARSQVPSAAGLQSRCPQRDGMQFQQRADTTSSSPSPGGRPVESGVLSSCPTQQIYCPALPPFPTQLRASQKRVLWPGRRAPFGRSGSLWEVRIPSGGQDPLGKSGSPPSPSSSSANTTSAEPSWQLHRAAARSPAHAASCPPSPVRAFSDISGINPT